MSYHHQKGFGWPHLIFTLLLLFVVAGIVFPLVFRERHGGFRIEALNNAKAIAGALESFHKEYGMYPGEESRDLLAREHDDRFRFEDDANDYLAQLLVTDIIDSESYFYAGGVKGAIKGDDIQGSPDKLLAKGENSFAYIMAENKKPLTDFSSVTPLVIAPITAGTQNGIPLFDPGPYADKYIYGAVDGSGKIGEIGKTGLPLSKGRIHLFQTGPDSLFGDETPVVKYPLGLKPPTTPTNK